MSSYLIGKTIDQYQILEVLGHGGMGTVYKAHDTVLDKAIALKMMDLRLSDNKEFLKRFRNEGKSQARLQHPNIVTVFSMRDSEHGFYIAMEYVDGITLGERIKNQGPLSPAEAVSLFNQILAAISHAHESGIIHRDVKPGNFLLAPDSTVKTTDFGMARIEQDAAITGTQVSGGTLIYSSPEQIKSLKYTDLRSDIYSLGMTLYEMLAGSLPFKDTDSNLDIQLAVVEGRIPPPNEVNPNIPDSLTQIILKAINVDPDQRFQSVNDFATALQDLKTSHPATSPAPTHKTKTPPAVTISASKSSQEHDTQLLNSVDKSAPIPDAETIVNTSSPRQSTHRLIIAVAAIAGLLAAFWLYGLIDSRNESSAALAHGTVMLTITSTPADANITVDATNIDTVRTPAVIRNLPAGERLITISKSGYDDYATRVTLSNARDLLLHADLSVQTLSVSIKSEPVGARIIINDTEVIGMITPAVVTGLEAGKHRILLQKTGYKSFEKEVVVLSGDQVKEVFHTFARNEVAATENGGASGTSTTKAPTEPSGPDWQRVEVLLRDAIVLAESNRSEKAIELYTEALKIVPNYSLAFAHRGYAYDNLGKYLKAVEDYNKALELNEWDVRTYVNRGIALNKLQRYDRAIQDFSQAIKLAPVTKEAFAHRGMAYNNSGNISAAISDYNRAIELDARYALAYNNRGVAYASLQKYEKAVSDFETATELNPDFALAYYNLGCLAAVASDTTRALNLLDMALARGFKHFAQLDSDADWNALRTLDEYRRIMSNYR